MGPVGTLEMQRGDFLSNACRRLNVFFSSRQGHPRNQELTPQISDRSGRFGFGSGTCWARLHEIQR